MKSFRTTRFICLGLLDFRFYLDTRVKNKRVSKNETKNSTLAAAEAVLCFLFT